MAGSTTWVRELAATLCREDGTAEEAIAEVLAEPEREGQTVLFYVDRMRAVAGLKGLSMSSRKSVIIGHVGPVTPARSAPP